MLNSLLPTIKQFAVEHAPKALKIPNSLIPKTLKLIVIEKALNTIFSEAIEDGDFEFLKDRWLQIDVQDLNLNFCVSFKSNKIICSHHSAEINLKFSAKTNDLLLLMGRQEDPDSLFFQRRLLIEGDTEMGLEVKNLIDAIDFDTWPTSIKSPLENLSSFIANNSKSTTLSSADA